MLFLHLIDRETAKRFGLKRFFTGRPCKRGGVAERLTGSANCRCAECTITHRSANKAYRNGPNREKLLQSKRDDYAMRAEELARRQRERRNSDIDAYRAASLQYRLKNKEKVNKWHRESWVRNRESKLEKRKLYYAERKMDFMAKNAQRRALQIQRMPQWFGELDEFVIAECLHLCRLRRQCTGMAWHTDHMIPLNGRRASGLHCSGNLQVIPSVMNLSKKNRLKNH